MKFSIIVPIFRVEKYLVECIESIIDQSFTDYELILVDDGSDDGCPMICDSYAQNHPNIKVIHKENGGLVSARKCGAIQASGDYILNIDGDDWVQADYLQTINKAIEASNDADIVIWGTTLCRNNKKTVYKIWNKEFGLYENEDINEVTHRYLYDKTVIATNSGSVSINLVTKAVKKELYKEQQQRIDNTVTKGEDALLSFYLLQKANSIYYLDYYGYNYRYVEQSMSNRVSTKDFRILSNLVRNMRDNIIGDRILKNQVSVYALWRLMGLFAPLAKNVSYKKFKMIINDVDVALMKEASSAVIYQKRIKDSIKIFLIKHRLWLPMYILLKRM